MQNHHKSRMNTFYRPVRAVILVVFVTVLIFVTLKLFEVDYDIGSFYPNTPCRPMSDEAERRELGKQLQALAGNILTVQKDFEDSSHYSYSMGYHFDKVNDILKLLKQDTIPRPKAHAPELVSRVSKQEVCPEIFAGEDLAYGAPYYRLGFARVKCKDFVPIDKLMTLLMLVPNEYAAPAMSYFEMMTTISNDYSGISVILITENELPRENVQKISALKIKFKNVLIKGTKGSMWKNLLNQVETPYVLIAPYLTHFDDDINLYRLLRVLSYRSDVAVAGGSYRNLSGHWDLGCRQVSFDYWTARYIGGYYRSFNECVVCDYLPGPFAAKTEWLNSLSFDTSLSEGVFYDLFWRFKNQRSSKTDGGSVAVVCADVMFNIDPPNTPNKALVNFANKHEVKKMVTSDGRVRWFGCRDGLDYTNKTGCSWPDGIGVPPCDLWNLGEVVSFVMQACERGKMVCEYVAGDIVGAIRFGSTHAWAKNAEIYFHTNNFTAFNKLRQKFEELGFDFKSDEVGLGRFTISTRNWHVIMRGKESLEVGHLLAQGQLPTRVYVGGAWVAVPRNPGQFARGHFLARHFSSASKVHGEDAYYSQSSPTKCPNPQHSACLDRYPVGSNIQFLHNIR